MMKSVLDDFQGKLLTVWNKNNLGNTHKWVIRGGSGKDGLKLQVVTLKHDTICISFAIKHILL